MRVRLVSSLPLLFVLLHPATSVGDTGSLEREDALPPGSELTAREIYERVLANRFDSYVQTSSLVSGDRGESEQESRLRMVWKNFRSERERVLSKSLIEYLHPFELRFSGYLIIRNEHRPSDQFLYLASSRRTRRVNLRGEAIFGTDFSFEDVVPREIEEADYRRLSDGLEAGVPCYVVEVAPRAQARSEYSRFVVHVETEHFVPLRTRYWDDRGLEVKELRASPESIREFDGVWIPMRATMRNLQLDTFTTLRVEDLEPNPSLSRSTFDLSRLESH